MPPQSCNRTEEEYLISHRCLCSTQIYSARSSSDDSKPGQEFSIQLTMGRENFPIRADRREKFPDNANEQRNFPDRKFPDPIGKTKFSRWRIRSRVFLSPYLRSTISDRAHIWSKCSQSLDTSTDQRKVRGDAPFSRHIDSKILFPMGTYGRNFCFSPVQESNGKIVNSQNFLLQRF